MKKILTIRTVAIAIKVLGLLSMILIGGEFLGFIAPLPKAAFIPSPTQLGIAFLISAILTIMPMAKLQGWLGAVVEKKIKE
jgi:hypothetical protein